MLYRKLLRVGEPRPSQSPSVTALPKGEPRSSQSPSVTALPKGEPRPSQSPSVTALPKGEPRRESQGENQGHLASPFGRGGRAKRGRRGRGRRERSASETLFYYIGNCSAIPYIAKKALRANYAHSRDRYVSLTRPRSARKSFASETLFYDSVSVSPVRIVAR